MDVVDSNEQTESECRLDDPLGLSIKNPITSGWKCYLFGSQEGAGLVWIPDEGCLPNVFVRFFMKVCLGCTWVKQETKKN